MVFSLGVFADLHREHDNLGGHGGHLVGEAVGVDAIHTGREGVPPVGLTLPLMDGLPLRVVDLYVNVKEASLCNLKCQTCKDWKVLLLNSCVHLIALFLWKRGKLAKGNI